MEFSKLNIQEENHELLQSGNRDDAQLRLITEHLNDDIVADDWLIPSEEISDKRLIKRTPRYNVYKADWFGDVLVYEPTIQGKQQQQQQQQQPHLASRRQQSVRQINQDELNCRLNRLDLSTNLMALPPSPLSPVSVFSFPDSASVSSDSEQIDSAYSSISSTPHYQTKNMNKSEFSFPANKFACSPSLVSSTSSIDDNNDNFNENSNRSPLPDVEVISERQQRRTSDRRNSMPVILNKDSFKFYTQNHGIVDPSTLKNIDNANSDSNHQSSCWFELNELRLVAHEGFMLFMGASMDEPQLEGGASLVMQMNHPKAVSLYHLLHFQNSRFTSGFSSSPRTNNSISSFNYKQQLPMSLNQGAKLNICQQVMNAMTYLHDKNIVHGKLTSVNIYIELNQRVKISLIDDDDRAIAKPIQTTQNLINSVEFNLPSLTYLSPELIKTLSVVDATRSGCDKKNVPTHVQFDTNQLTKASDIFSFGTLLFELFEERFPFAQIQEQDTRNSLKLSILNLLKLSTSTTQSQWNGNIKASANQLIYQIGSGQIECKNLRSLDKISRSSALVELIEKCWSQDPLMRPQFKQLASHYFNDNNSYYLLK